jgi:predicted esterase
MGNLLKLIDTSTHGKGVRITHIHRTGLTRLPYRLPSDCYTDLDQIGVPAWIRFHEGAHSDFASAQWGANYFKSMVGDNETDLLQRSPISNVGALKAAVMLVHGSEDQRVPIANAEQLRDALGKRHIAYEWLQKRGEGHGFYDEKNIAEFYEKMLKFLDKHIGAGAKAAAH